MNINFITADIRTVSYGAPTYEVRIEERVAGEWATHWSTNEASNDFSSSERNAALDGLRYAHWVRDSLARNAAKAAAA